MTIRSLSIRGRVSAASAVLLAATLAACAASQEPERSALAQGESRAAQSLAADTGAAAATAGDAQAAGDPVLDSVSDLGIAEPEAAPEPEAPASDDPDRDLLDAALAAAADGDVARAERNLQQLVRHEEYGPYASYNLGVIAYARAQRDQARRHFQSALELQPGFGPALVALVREQLATGRSAEARQLIETQRRASDDASGVRAAALFLDLAAGDAHAVINASRGVLIDEPTNLDVFYALAMANVQLGRYESAEYILNQALRRDENRADIYYALGRVALARDRETDARGFFERALQLNPTYPEANVDLASLQLRKLEYAQVVAGLEPVVKNLPEFVEAWINYGSGLKGVGRVDEAKQAFEAALALDPHNAQAAFNLGILYLDVSGFESLEQLPRMEQALAWFSKYRELEGSIDSDDPVIAYEQFVRDEIKMQEDLARQAAEDAERARARAEREAADREAGESGGDGWDDWGDDSSGGSDDGWDDWGDDSSGGSDDGWDDWGGDAPSEPAPAPTPAPAPAAPADDGWDDWDDGASVDPAPVAPTVDAASAASSAPAAAPAPVEAPATVEAAPAAAAESPSVIIVENEPAPAAPAVEAPAAPTVVEVVEEAPVHEAPAAAPAPAPAAPSSSGGGHDDWGDDWDAW